MPLPRQMFQDVVKLAERLVIHNQRIDIRQQQHRPRTFERKLPVKRNKRRASEQTCQDVGIGHFVAIGEYTNAAGRPRTPSISRHAQRRAVSASSL